MKSHSFKKNGGDDNNNANRRTLCEIYCIVLDVLNTLAQSTKAEK